MIDDELTEERVLSLRETIPNDKSLTCAEKSMLSNTVDEVISRVGIKS